MSSERIDLAEFVAIAYEAYLITSVMNFSSDRLDANSIIGSLWSVIFLFIKNSGYGIEKLSRW